MLWWQPVNRTWLPTPLQAVSTPRTNGVVCVVCGPIASGKSTMAAAMALQLGPGAVFVDGDKLHGCKDTLALGSHRNDATQMAIAEAFMRRDARIVLIAAGGKALLTNYGRTQRNDLAQLLPRMGLDIEFVYACMSAPQQHTPLSVSGWMTAKAFDDAAETLYKLDDKAFEAALEGRAARGVPMGSLPT